MTGPEAYQALAQYYALQLEVRTGIKFSNKGSIAKHIRKQHGIEGRTKQQTLDNFGDYLREEGVLRA